MNGVYKYKCDAHPSQMKGSFRAGPAPPPPPKLTAKVGPGKTITLKKGGAAVKSLVAGTYKVVVKDATKKDNFHLVAPRREQEDGHPRPGQRHLDGQVQGRQGLLPLGRVEEAQAGVQDRRAAPPTP